MNKNKPKISIVIPSLNQGQFIYKAISSVVNQAYPHVECFVIDGGSTDNTVSIIKEHENSLDAWISETDRGQANAINKGLRLATGDIINWLNSDDYLAPGALNKIADNWESGYGLLVGRGHKVKLDDRVYYSPFPREVNYESLFHWMEGANFMQPAAFFSREAYEKCGPLDESLNFCMDVDFYIKIARHFKIGMLDEDIAYAYEHPSAKSTAMKQEMMAETLLMFAKQGNMTRAKDELERYFRLYTPKPSIKSGIKEDYRWFKKFIANAIGYKR